MQPPANRCPCHEYRPLAQAQVLRSPASLA